MNFVAHARLFDQPDPRRLDLRASVQNLNGDWLVRTYLQRSALPVKAVVDVSQSMRFGTPGKLQVAADFLSALGNSAHGYGDTVSLLGFDNTFREDLYLPAGKGAAMGATMADRVLSSPANKNPVSDSDGLADTVDRIIGTRGIVFLLSDFHWSLTKLTKLIDALSTATVVPLVIWDKSEVIPPKPGQWLAARDMRSQHTHHLWITSKTRQQWLDNVIHRRSEIIATFAERGCLPVFFEGSFNAERISQYFMEQII
jgi:uncharacterized protein (DUF58 family)